MMPSSSRLTSERLLAGTCANSVPSFKLLSKLVLTKPFSIAYAFTTDPDKIYTVTNWPGAEDRIVPKAPTVIQYDVDSKTSFKWGYEVDQLDENKIANLKLLLDPDQPRPYFIPTDAEAEMAKLPKSPVEVISDYMGVIFKHAIAEIEGESLDPKFLDGFQKHFVLTVPAVWSDKAKSMTLQVRSRSSKLPTRSSNRVHRLLNGPASSRLK